MNQPIPRHWHRILQQAAPLTASSFAPPSAVQITFVLLVHSGTRGKNKGHLEDVLINGMLGHEPDDLHLLELAQPVHPVIIVMKKRGIRAENLGQGTEGQEPVFCLPIHLRVEATVIENYSVG